VCELICSFIDRERDGWWVRCLSKSWLAWTEQEVIAETDIKWAFTSINRLEAVLAGKYGEGAKNMIVDEGSEGLYGLSIATYVNAVKVGSCDVVDKVFPVDSLRGREMANKMAASMGRVEFLKRNDDFEENTPEVLTTIEKYKNDLQVKRRPTLDSSLGLLVYGLLDPIACTQNHRMLRWLFNWVMAHGVHIYQLMEYTLKQLPYALDSVRQDGVAYLWAVADYIPEWSQVAHRGDVHAGRLEFVMRLLKVGGHSVDAWTFCKEYTKYTMDIPTFPDLLYTLCEMFSDERASLAYTLDNSLKNGARALLKWLKEEADRPEEWIQKEAFAHFLRRLRLRR